MLVSIFLAKVFAIYLIVFGIALLTRKQMFIEAMDSLLENPGSLFLLTIITLILGCLLVVAHNVWVMGWPVIITIIAWLTLIKGVVRLFCPGMLGKAIKNSKILTIAPLVALVIGCYLAYVGFFV